MRIYVKLSDKMGERLDEYAKDFGMSKSGFVAYCVGKHINELDRQSQVYDVVGTVLSDYVGSQANEKGTTQNDDLSINEM